MNEMPDISTIMNMMNAMSNNKASSGSSEGSILDNIAEYQKRQSGNDTQSSYNNSSNNMPDPETLMRIMKVISAMNSQQNNASTNLLNSLRPFLRESKKEKLDQYVKFMKISSAISELNHLEGDEK